MFKHVVRRTATLLLIFLTIGVGQALACPPPPAPEVSAASALFDTLSWAAALTPGDPFYYTDGVTPRPAKTHSGIPYLPSYRGYMQTNNTYRFVNINEQVITMIGEGKHGLWRIQDSGTVREYLRAGAEGLPAGADISDPVNLAVIRRDYSHLLVGEGFGGYKDPFAPINPAGRMSFVDLTITHAKYGRKYDKHVPIELPHWYCTMSNFDFPEAADAVQFAFAQPGANVVGSLGKRAGLDIKELYTNVLRLKPFPDARAWVNVGTDSNVDWQAIDVRKTSAEFYLLERPFFNVPYLFVTAVFDDAKTGDFRYVRPHGAYYKHLKSRGAKLKTKVTLAPRFHLESGARRVRVAGTKLYGVHHPNRPREYGAGGGGACPRKGGDWAGYPDTKGGAGWPTQWEEITPLCDGVLVDIKFFANLNGAPWNSSRAYLANAAVGTTHVTYTVGEGLYGVFVDRYHTSRGIKNPETTYIGPAEVLTYKTVRPPVAYNRKN